MKKTRNSVRLAAAQLLSRRKLFFAILIVFIFSTTTTVTVGYGLQQKNRVARQSPTQEAQEKVAFIPSLKPSTSPINRPTSRPVISPSPSVVPSPTADTSTPSPSSSSAPNVPQSTTTPTSSPTPQPSPSSSASPSPSPTPEPEEPNPPIIEITYPSEGVTIILSAREQQICLTEEVRGGNTTGLQRKHAINNQGWTEYVDMNTLCFDPQPLVNVVKTKYRNVHGDESGEYTRTFIVVL